MASEAVQALLQAAASRNDQAALVNVAGVLSHPGRSTAAPSAADAPGPGPSPARLQALVLCAETCIQVGGAQCVKVKITGLHARSVQVHCTLTVTAA